MALRCFLTRHDTDTGVIAHQYIPSHFNATTTGLPGNDDTGAMGSFAVWSISGLFPIPGQSVYLVTVPFFRSVSWTSPLTGKTATIRVQNSDGSESKGGRYVQNATLNGKAYTRNWISHDFFTQGQTLELFVGSDANSTWGTREEDVPPSPAKGSAGTAGLYAMANSNGTTMSSVDLASLVEMGTKLP